MTMSIVFAGTPENAATTLRELAVSGIQIALVITRPDAPVGRKRVLTPSPVALVAQELGLPILKAAKLETAEIERIRDSNASLGIVVAYGALLREPALAALELGWFNLHYSLLPAWRGAAPVQHSLLNTQSVTGVTLFKIDEGLDTGDVVSQVPVAVEISDNTQTLLKRLTSIGTSLLIQEIPRILADIASLTPQSTEGVTLAPKPTRQDARLERTDKSVRLLAKVRAFNPEPGAWLIWQDQPFKILDAARTNEPGVDPFTVSMIGETVLMGTSDGSLRLIEVQPSGKTKMSARDWFRGTTENTRTFS
jgi:methionyl-tRNA formyltransferase